MFEIFVAGPDLSLVDRLDAFQKGIQEMSAVENIPPTSWSAFKNLESCIPLRPSAKFRIALIYPMIRLGSTLCLPTKFRAIECN